ncbi:MAG: site-specific integrase [Symbiobacteriaceae bacterium]|nr:site-specific integrase [Symbiobacteriaceae bacterium]
MPKKNKDGYFRSTMVVGHTPEGKPHRITIRARNRPEFERKLDEAKRMRSSGFVYNDLTVAEWASTWLRVYKANATPTQQDHYATKVRLDILPAIGHMRLRDVRTSHLKDLLNAYAGGKVGTVTKIRIAIRQLFSDAEAEGLIMRNPAARLELPELTEDARRPLTDVERAAVYETAKTHPRGVYVLTLLCCGLRRGECLALNVGDVDFEHTRIKITKNLEMRSNVGSLGDTKAGKLRKRKVKGDASVGFRDVPIPDILLPYLMRQCEGRSPTDILFPKTDGSRATQTACKWWWSSFTRQCHITAGAKLYRNRVLTESSPFAEEVTPHYLRHTYATDLFAAGIDDATQKYLLGHSLADVTDIYRKMNDTSFTRATGMLNEYFKEMCQKCAKVEKQIVANPAV